MGAILVQIFDIVSNRLGNKGRMQLAVRTGISRTRAAEIPDDPETVAKFKKAATEILGTPPPD